MTAAANNLARIRKELRDSELSLIDRLGPQPVAWLALMPSWDEALAKRCDFPTSSLDEFLVECEEEGLCKREVPVTARSLVWPRLRSLGQLTGIAKGSRQRRILDYLEKHLPTLAAADRLEIRIAVLESMRRGDSAQRKSKGGPRPRNNQYDAWLEDALEDASSIENSADRSIVLARIAVLEKSRERADEALEIAQGIEDDDGRAMAVARVTDLFADMRTEDWAASVAWPDRDWLSPYVANLNDSNPSRRRSAAAVLAAAGEIAADDLVEALQNNDRMVQRQAVTALGRLGGAALRPLLNVANGKDRRLRSHAVGAIGQLQLSDAVPELIEILNGDDAVLRAAAARALGESRATEATDALVSAMHSESMGSKARLDAAIAVVRLGAKPALAEEAIEVIKAEAADSEAAAKLLAGVLTLLPAENRDDYVRDSLEDAARSDDELRSQLLADIAPAAGRHSRRLLQVCLEIADSELRIETLGAIGPHLPQRQLENAIEAILMAGEAGRFWMPRTARRRIASLLQSGFGISLEADAQQVADAIRKARDGGYPVTVGQRRWADLAGRFASGGAASVGNYLIRRVRDLVTEGSTAAATEWIAVGESLATTLRGELESAVLLCHRLMEMEYRRQQDERFLEHFFERAEQVEAFKDLITGSDEAWALHYLGVGGVGKTMLMRHVTARLAGEFELAIARIDFDYLSPDYPSRKPGQLLLELGAGLRAYPNVERNYQVLQNRVLELHERLAEEPPRDDPLANVNNEEFEYLLTPFVSMLERLGQRALLILDTCEELAKLHPVGERMPSVEATFEILHRIHQRVPSLRVIFAGRRPLAREGHGWKLNPNSMSVVDSLLPERVEFLRLMEVRGFDETEAVDYLTSTRGLSLAAGMQEAVLSRSPELGRTADMIQEERPANGSTRRYNPFDLALYAEWLSDDPELPAEDISSGDADPYVQMRIINRIKRERVRELMPAAVLLRRFTSGMIRDALDTSEDVFKEAFGALGDQEWINIQHDEALNTTFFEIDRGLLPRLHRYYEHPDRRPQIETAKHRIGPSIDRGIRAQRLDQLSVDHLDAAFRILPPSEAGDLWDHVTERFGAECDWNWVDTVTRRILSDEGAIGEGPHPLRSAVLAARISAATHLNPGGDQRREWMRMTPATPADDPDPPRRNWLRQRSLAGVSRGLLITGYMARGVLPPDYWRSQLETVSEVIASVEVTTDASALETSYKNLQLAASAVATIDALTGAIELETAELLSHDDKELLWLVVAFLGRLWSTKTTGDLRHFASDLAERLRLVLGENVNEKLDDLESPDLSPGHWLDWRPGDLLHRLRFERLRRVHSAVIASRFALVTSWLQAALKDLQSVDADRLVSLILGRQLAIAVPDSYLEEIGGALNYERERQPLALSHLAAPPLFVSLARCWLAKGEADRAMFTLEPQLREATIVAGDVGTVRVVEETKLEIMRRMRLLHLEPNLIERYWTSSDIEKELAAVPVVTLNSSAVEPGEAPKTNDAHILHVLWQSRGAPTRETAAGILADFESKVREETTDSGWLQRAHWYLDTVEWALLAQRVEYGNAEVPDVSRMEIPETSRDAPEEVFRLHLRVATLFGQELNMDWRGQIGVRRMAEIALHEGETLALRLADLGYSMLKQASDWFAEAADDNGRAISFTCAMMAMLRARHLGMPPAGTSAVDEFDNYVTTFRDQLPGWSEADGIGWQLRYRACAQALDVGPQLVDFEIMPARVFVRFVREQIGIAGRLPVELEGWLDDYEASAFEAGSAEAPARSPEPEMKVAAGGGDVAKAPGVWSTIGYAVFGMAISIGFLALIYLGVGWGIGLAVPQGVGTGWQVAATVAVVMVLGYSPGLVQRLFSRVASKSQIVLRIASSTSSSVVNLGVSIRRARLKLQPPFVGLSERESWTEPSADSSGDDLTELLSQSKGIEIISELAGRSRYHSLPVCLRLIGGESAKAVERQVVQAIRTDLAEQKKGRPVIDPFRLPPETNVRTDLEPSRLESVTVLTSSTWAHVARSVWQDVPSVLVSDTVPYYSGADISGVVHLIGNPVQTSSGLYLDIGDSARFESMTKLSSGEANFERSDRLLAADAFARVNVKLCILQGAPVTDDGPVRTEIYEEQTEELRNFAIDLMQTGMRHVLVVPSLPSGPGAAALTSFTKSMGKKVPVPFPRLIKATAALRQQVAAVGELVEWDVTLYTPAPWTTSRDEDPTSRSRTTESQMEETS